MTELPKVKNIKRTRVEIAIRFILVVALVAGFIKLFAWNSPGAISEETKHKETSITTEDFAKCLNGKGLIMYGDDTCEKCQAQKKMFGDAFSEINYVNCYFEKDKCAAAGVTGYPMWVIEEKKLSGLQKFSNLSALTGCEASNINK